MKDLTPEEAGRWMDAAPQIVQDAVTSPETERAIEQIGRQYALHVDVVGLLLKLASYMLLGYARPEDSFKELCAANVPDEQARRIISDINQKIFVPLRARMEKGAPVSHFHLENKLAAPPSSPPPEGRLTSLNQASPDPASPSFVPSVSLIPIPPRPAESLDETPPVRPNPAPPQPLLPPVPAKPYSIDPYREPTDEKSDGE